MCFLFRPTHFLQFAAMVTVPEEDTVDREDVLA